MSTMFPVWTCKQVMDIAGTNLNQSKYKEDHDPKCPSCGQVDESYHHVLNCNESGRVEALSWSIDLIDDWMKKVGTDTALCKSIVEYAQGRGGKSMMDVTRFRGARFGKLAPSQDRIG